MLLFHLAPGMCRCTFRFVRPDQSGCSLRPRSFGSTRALSVFSFSLVLVLSPHRDDFFLPASRAFRATFCFCYLFSAPVKPKLRRMVCETIASGYRGFPNVLHTLLDVIGHYSSFILTTRFLICLYCIRLLE